MLNSTLYDVIIGSVRFLTWHKKMVKVDKVTEIIRVYKVVQFKNKPISSINLCLSSGTCYVNTTPNAISGDWWMVWLLIHIFSILLFRFLNSRHIQIVFILRVGQHINCLIMARTLRTLISWLKWCLKLE